MKKLKLLFPLCLMLGMFAAGCKGKPFELRYFASEGGYVIGNSAQSLSKGESGLSVEAIPKEGYVFSGWSDGERSAKRTDADLKEDTSFTAQFTKIGKFTLEYLADEGGYVIGNPLQTLFMGESGSQVEAIPKEGYSFSGWSDGETSAKRTDADLREDTSFTARFTKIERITLEYLAGEGGFIDGDPHQEMGKGESGLSVEAVPRPGFEFVKWSDGLETPVRREEAPSENLSVTAEFQRIPTFALVYTATEGGYLSGEERQEVLSGNTGTEVRAVNSVGYVFRRWSDGNASPVRTDDTEGAFEAIFEKDLYNLPVFEIRTDGNAPILDKQNYVDCTVTLFNTEESFSFSDRRAGIRLRGNSTLTFPKKPYRIKFEEKTSLFGWAKNKSWVLLAMYNDFSNIKDYTALTVAKSIMKDSFVPNARHVELYLNGEFMGLYLLTDQIDEKAGRLDVECDFTAEDEDIPFYVEWDENALFEGAEGSEWFRIVNEDSGVTSYYEVKYPEAEDRQSEAQFDYIKGYIEKVNSLCHDPDTTREEFEEYVDFQSFLDYYLLQELFGQGEINWKSIHMSKEKGGKLKMGPVWDFDWALGGPMDIWSKGNTVTGDWMSLSNWFFYMMQKDWFRAAARVRFDEIKGPVLKKVGEIHTLRETLLKSGLRNAAMWDFDTENIYPDFLELFDFVTAEFFPRRIQVIEGLLS